MEVGPLDLKREERGGRNPDGPENLQAIVVTPPLTNYPLVRASAPKPSGYRPSVQSVARPSPSMMGSGTSMSARPSFSSEACCRVSTQQCLLTEPLAQAHMTACEWQ